MNVSVKVCVQMGHSDNFVIISSADFNHTMAMIDSIPICNTVDMIFNGTLKRLKKLEKPHKLCKICDLRLAVIGYDGRCDSYDCVHNKIKEILKTKYN